MIARIRARRRSERGGVLVELALVTPVLVALVMGIIDFGTMFTENISLRGGVREADWNAARGILGSADGCTLTFSGTAPDAATQRVMCMVKDRSGLPASDLRVRVRLVNLADPSLPGTGAVGHGIMVCAMRPARSITGFYGSVLSGRVQRARLTNVIISADAANPIGGGQETAIAGQDWSWCDPQVAPPA